MRAERAVENHGDESQFVDCKMINMGGNTRRKTKERLPAVETDEARRAHRRAFLSSMTAN